MVSFDVFDTLLLRVFPSEYVTELAAMKLRDLVHAETTLKISTSEIIESRKDFSLSKDGKSAEWIIGEWLKGSAEQFGIDPVLFSKLGRQAEIEAEISVLVPNAKVSLVLEKLKDEKCVKIAVSDIWLEEEDLESILGHFKMHFEKVYTSGTQKASKSKGTVFGTVEKDFPRAEFVHIGDNLASDFVIPRIKGWDSIWVPRRHPFLPTWIPKTFWKGPLRPKPENYIEKILMPQDFESCRSLSQMGYFFLAPVLIVFSLIQWKLFREEAIDVVFFIARDAKIPFEVFRKMSGMLPECPSFHYCRISRKSVALLHPKNLLAKALPMPGKIGKKTVGEWLDNFTVEEDLKTKILRESELSKGARFCPSAREKIKKACRKFEKEIIVEIDRHGELLKDYLEGVGKNSNLKRIALVDSGWAGTIQDCLANSLKDTDMVCGIYLGAGNQGLAPSRNSKKYGMLRDDFRNCKHHDPVDSSAGAIRVWDTILTEPVGTVAKIIRKDGVATPVLKRSSGISCREREIHRTIIESVLRRVDDSEEEIKLLAGCVNLWTLEDLEKAALNFSRHITVMPSKEIAREIIGRRVEEGAGSAKKTSLGFRGIKTGTAWYPGLISVATGSSFSRILSIPLRNLARAIRYMKIQGRGDNLEISRRS